MSSAGPKRPCGRLRASVCLGLALLAAVAFALSFVTERPSGRLFELPAGTDPGGAGAAMAISGQADRAVLRGNVDILALVLADEVARVSTTQSGVREGLQDSASPEGTDAAMRETLRRLYPGLARLGYFVLWRGTVDVASPLTPDTAGLDFADRQDAAGRWLVREMRLAAQSGGGYSQFTLEGEGGRLHDYLCYSVPVPGTDCHLSAWRPLAGGADGLSSVAGADLARPLRTWLRIAGFAMLGLALLACPLEWGRMLRKRLRLSPR